MLDILNNLDVLTPIIALSAFILSLCSFWNSKN